MCKCVNIRMLLLHSTPKTVPPFWVITDGTSLDQDIQDVRQIIASAVEQVRPIMDTRQHQLILRDSSVAASIFGDQKRLVHGQRRPEQSRNRSPKSLPARHRTTRHGRRRSALFLSPYLSVLWRRYP